MHATVADTLPGLLDEIGELLDAPVSDRSAARLSEIEETLTDGYACALQLEAERWRFEQRIDELVRLPQRGDDVGGELTELAQNASAAGIELAQLRVLLDSLRARARFIRQKS